MFIISNRFTFLPRLPLLKSKHCFAIVAFLAFQSSVLASEEYLKPDDRIVFIGDSITAQGAKSPTGWAHLVQQALEESHPDTRYKVTSLGGGGQTLESWQKIEEKSRSEAVILDVKDIDVKATLDQGAEVIICMLGMNNVLSPSLSDQKEGYDLWAAHYREFIGALRKRVHPRIFAIATPTLCTEDRSSPKNRAIESLIKKITEIATSEHCVVLPTHEMMQWLLDEGRMRQPEFHVTGDFVHPNQAGHVAIAAGMLKGLNENSAGERLLQAWLPRLWNEKEETLSYQVERIPSQEKEELEVFRIHYDYKTSKPSSSPSISLTCPDGWKVISSDSASSSGSFLVQGIPEKLDNTFVLSAGMKTTRINIPAPWLLGVGSPGGRGWTGINFDPELGKLPVDDKLPTGQGFGHSSEVAPGHPMLWKRYFANIGYAGGNSPGALDLAATTFFQANDVCYGARWLFSAHERPATIETVSLGPSGKNFLSIWLNGINIHSGPIQTQVEATPIQLNKGWNCLVFKSNHRQWRWQFSINLVARDGDDWSDIRIKIEPPQ